MEELVVVLVIMTYLIDTIISPLRNLCYLGCFLSKVSSIECAVSKDTLICKLMILGDSE